MGTNAHKYISFSCMSCLSFTYLFYYLHSLFLTIQPLEYCSQWLTLFSSVSKTGFKCKHEFCWDCLKDYKEIRRAGNDKHAPTCPFHTNNIRD